VFWKSVGCWYWWNGGWCQPYCVGCP